MNLLWGCSFFYAAYPTRVLCLRDLEMFRSPFGATTPFILIALKGWSENGSWPLMFDTENHNSSSNFEDWKTAKGLTDQRKISTIQWDNSSSNFDWKSRKRSDGPWQEKLWLRLWSKPRRVNASYAVKMEDSFWGISSRQKIWWIDRRHSLRTFGEIGHGG